MNYPPSRLWLLVRPLLLGLLAASAPVASFADGSDCSAAYRPEYRDVWSVDAEAWSALCANLGTADAALVEAQRAYIERCVDAARPDVAARRTDESTARALCARGGKPRPALWPPSRSDAGLSPDAAGLAGHRELDATLGRIRGELGDVASIYGEKGGDAGAGAPGARPADASPQGAPPPAAAPKGKTPPVAVPSPSAPFPPKGAENAALLQTLDGRLKTNGAGTEASEYLRARYRDEISHLGPGTLQRLVDDKVYLEIIPRGKKLTDVPPFTRLRGQKTFDGRRWETVKGVAGVPMPDGGSAVAVPEDNLIGKGPRAGGYPKGFVFFHEYGHAVHLHGLPDKSSPPAGMLEQLIRWVWGNPATKAEVTAVYDESMKRPQKTGLGPYADANEREFFAQAAAAYFGVGYQGETARTLKKVNPKMYDLMRRIYGKPDRYKVTP